MTIEEKVEELNKFTGRTLTITCYMFSGWEVSSYAKVFNKRKDDDKGRVGFLGIGDYVRANTFVDAIDLAYEKMREIQKLPTPSDDRKDEQRRDAEDMRQEIMKNKEEAIDE